MPMHPSPLQYGLVYHIYNRGNNRDNLFFEDRNYRYFLQLYARYIEPINVPALCFNGLSGGYPSRPTPTSRG